MHNDSDKNEQKYLLLLRLANDSLGGSLNDSLLDESGLLLLLHHTLGRSLDHPLLLLDESLHGSLANDATAAAHARNLLLLSASDHSSATTNLQETFD